MSWSHEAIRGWCFGREVAGIHPPVREAKHPPLADTQKNPSAETNGNVRKNNVKASAIYQFTG